MLDIHWFRLDPPKVKIWQKNCEKRLCGQVTPHILAEVSKAKPCTFQMDFLFGFLLLPTQIFGTSTGPGTPRVRAPPLLFQKEWEEYKNLPHSNLKTSVVNPTSWEQVGGKKDSFSNFSCMFRNANNFFKFEHLLF